MYYYAMYDFIIESEILIEGLEDVIVDYRSNKKVYIGCFRRKDFDMDKKDIHSRIGEAEICFFDKYIMLSYQNQWGIVVYKSGDRILVDSNATDMIQTNSILLGTGMSILLMYRGLYPVHAGAFVYNDCAIALVGKSGVGKSTFIRYVITQGYRMITEDTLPIKITPNGIITYSSKSIKSKLKPEVIDYFNIDSQYLGTIIEKTGKRWTSIPKENRSDKEMYPLKYIYFLNPISENVDIKIERLGQNTTKNKVLHSITSLDDLPVKDVFIKVRDIEMNLDLFQCYEITYTLGMDNFEQTFQAMLEHIQK